MQLPGLLISPRHNSAQRLGHDQAPRHTGRHDTYMEQIEVTLLASSTKEVASLPPLMMMPEQSSASSAAPSVEAPAALV